MHSFSRQIEGGGKEAGPCPARKYSQFMIIVKYCIGGAPPAVMIHDAEATKVLTLD
jgi:hypothetical protein